MNHSVKPSLVLSYAFDFCGMLLSRAGMRNELLSDKKPNLNSLFRIAFVMQKEFPVINILE